MKIQVNQPLKTIHGNNLEEVKGKSFTVKDAIVSGLLSQDNSENINGQKKFELYKLASKIQDAEGEVEITIEQAATIKERVGKSFTALVVGQVYEIIEKG
jgi:hypothetical protein